MLDIGDLGNLRFALLVLAGVLVLTSVISTCPVCCLRHLYTAGKKGVKGLLMKPEKHGCGMCCGRRCFFDRKPFTISYS